MCAGQDLLEGLDGVVERYELARRAGEHLGDVERLAKEALHLPGAGHGELVVLGQLIHTEDGDDVLERLVVLEQLLDRARELVVLLAHDARVQHARGGVQRVHGGVDPELGNRAGEHGRRVQVSKGRGRRRVGEVIGRHVDGLHGGDGSLGGGGDALLEGTHVRGKCRLVSHRGRNTSEQRRHFRTRLREAEDVVDEEEHVLALLVAEVLRDGKAGQGHAGARTRRLVHLSVHERGLGALGGVVRVVDLDDAAFHHLVVQVVALAGALSDAGEHGVATVVHGDVVDELHDDHGLADSGSSEEADLASLGVGREQVDDLDAGHENLGGLALLREGGRRRVDRRELVRGHGSALVDGLADDVDDAAKGRRADGHHDRVAGVLAGLSAHEALGGVHGDGAHRVLTQVLRDLEHEPRLALGDLHLQGVEDGRQLRVELNVHHGANDLRHLSDGGAHRRRCVERAHRGLRRAQRSHGISDRKHVPRVQVARTRTHLKTRAREAARALPDRHATRCALGI
mmetsp:Transcript_8741/g.32960  ORF Transcript_8741/g.32960 Transcript_8741/m.32960 type:complete len:514 (-) Transcript_8741:27-1568(-)